MAGVLSTQARTREPVHQDCQILVWRDWSSLFHILETLGQQT